MSVDPSVLAYYPHWYVRYALVQSILDRLSLLYDSRYEVRKTGYNPDLVISQWPAQQSQAYFPNGTSFSVAESMLPEYGRTKNVMPLLCAYFLILNKWQTKGWLIPDFQCPEEGTPVSPSDFGTTSGIRFAKYHGKPVSPGFGSYFFGDNAQYYWKSEDTAFYYPSPAQRGAFLQTPNLSYYMASAAVILNYCKGLIVAPHVPIDYSSSDPLFYQRTDLYCTATFTETTKCTWTEDGATRSETSQRTSDSSQENISGIAQSVGMWEENSKSYSADWEMQFHIVSVSPFRYKAVVFLWTALESGNASNSGVPFLSGDFDHSKYLSQAVYESSWQTGNFSHTITFRNIASSPCRFRIAHAQVIIQPEYPDRFSSVKDGDFEEITSRT